MAVVGIGKVVHTLANSGCEYRIRDIRDFLNAVGFGKTMQHAIVGRGIDHAVTSGCRAVVLIFRVTRSAARERRGIRPVQGGLANIYRTRVHQVAKYRQALTEKEASTFVGAIATQVCQAGLASRLRGIGIDNPGRAGFEVVFLGGA